MRRRVVGNGLLLLSLAGAAAAQLSLGPELQANSFTTGAQQSSTVSADPTGGFLVAWSESWSDYLSATVRVRRFGVSGTPQGAERRVNDEHGGNTWRRPTRILVDDDAQFTVVWGGYQGGPGCFCSGGRARRFESAGEPLDDSFVVAGMVRYGIFPVAAGRPNGDFVVATKESSPLDLTLYGPTGDVLGQAAIVAEPNHDHASPSLAIAPTGEFVVAWNDWERTAQYPSELLWDRILVQRFGATGAPIGAGIEVTAPESEGFRRYPKVARSASGSFLVVWEEDPTESGAPDATLLVARAYDAEGVPIGGPVQVSESTAGAQLGPTVAAAPDGTFLVAWTDWDGDGGGGDGSGAAVRARQLAATGSPASASLQINSFTTGDQRGPSLAFLPDGDLVVSWTSDGSFGNDDSEESIQVRRFRLAFFADGFESGDISRWSGGSG
jgi:hypothetical protein